MLSGTTDQPQPALSEPPETALFHELEFVEPGISAGEQPPAPTEMRLYDYARYSQLTGPLVKAVPGDAGVRYRRPPGVRPVRQTIGAAFVLVLQSCFLAWLLLPGHLPKLGHHIWIAAGSIVMVGSIYLIELFRLINVGSLCVASALARDPVPMAPAPGLRVAFLTSIVPSREPIVVVRQTLEAARRIRHAGVLDIWLLDEEDDPMVRAMCDELGVHHFSRFGVPEFNREAGCFKARTKHGNYNSWVAVHGPEYEFFVSVDPDHVPLPSFCERLLGYFRDPDVAFVVGPQVYGNYDNFVTKGAESQQFVFHGLIQRLGNRFRSPMLVGTNNAVRISALEQVGGLRDSITEDLATSLAFHSSINAETANNWVSVYTPDVLSVGEGPSNFTDFFSQQHRWARGTFENFRGHLWRSMRGLRMGPRLHYSLITSYYPSAAIGWILGGVNAVIYLTMGASGLKVPAHVWVAVYVDLAAVQFCLYASNRKHNVSPHELPGSSGAIGMFMSVLAAPIYVVALVGTMLRRKQGFVVTPKGTYASADTIATFRVHLAWGALVAAALVVSLWLDRPVATMRWWSLTLVCLCLTPYAISLYERARNHRLLRAEAIPPGAKARIANTVAAEHAGGMTQTEAA
ncbi:MAG: glycosyltransferase [Solirubrobacterales bacterium]|nr:glycosyltransferase [Solirubrobacterales bacterium]